MSRVATINDIKKLSKKGLAKKSKNGTNKKIKNAPNKKTKNVSTKKTKNIPNKKIKKIKSNRGKRIFIAGHMIYEIFTHQPLKQLLLRNGVSYTSKIKNADIIISNQIKSLIKYPNKKYLLYTHEPFFNTDFKNPIRSNGKVIPNMNIYSNKVYTNNFYYYPNILLDEISDEIIEERKEQFHKLNLVRTSFFATNENRKTKYSLSKLRNNVAMTGYKLGELDVYGRRWPKGMSEEDSRFGFQGISWGERKRLLLREKYCFNICFENTHYKYYVTEKLWDAIISYTLPIYKGSPWIYEIFPRGSFIDYNEFKNPQELFNFIKNMTFDEYLRRVKLCISTHRKYYNSESVKHRHDKAYQYILQQLKKM